MDDFATQKAIVDNLLERLSQTEKCIEMCLQNNELDSFRIKEYQLVREKIVVRLNDLLPK